MGTEIEKELSLYSYRDSLSQIDWHILYFRIIRLFFFKDNLTE